jgi:photosystem II stability/assembly factor-like uncharacterized protein
MRENMRTIILSFILLFTLTFSSFSQNYWTQIAQLPSTVECFTSAGDTLFAGTLGSGVYVSYNGGNNWAQINNGLSNLKIYSLVLGTNGLYAGTDSSGIYRSTNFGSSWVHSGLSSQYKVKAMAFGTDNSVYAGTFGDGIFKTTNNGTIWTRCIYSDSVEALAVHPSGNIFAGIRNPDIILRSTDQGVSWMQVDTGVHAFNSIKVSPFNNDIYGITGDLITDNLIGDVIVRSTDGGTTWTAPYSFATSSFGMAINSIGHIFVGRYNGAWESTDNGENWTVHNTGINTYNGLLLSYCLNAGGYILAGQETGTVYRSLGSTIGIRKISSEVPKEFSLYQNYPNPFNPSTKIKFEIPTSPLYERGVGGFVVLKIYDFLGREIATLVNEQLNPGTYEVSWEASQFASGTYFCKLSSGSYNEAKKMVVIK